MKQFLVILLLFCCNALWGQKESDKTEMECAANAGGDRIICYTDQMNLSAPVDQFYANPPNIQWTFISGPGPVKIFEEHAFNTNVINQSGFATWPTGDYLFEFCVDCQDLNGNGQMDRPCDTVMITVKPDVPQPVITENDGNENGKIKGCTELSFNINASAMGLGDTLKYDSDPDYPGHLDVTVNGDVVTIKSLDRANCDYDFVFSFTNGGCTRSANIKVTLANQELNENGVVAGWIENCPSCTTTVNLWGDSPGCSGIGEWTVTSTPPNADDPIFTNIQLGSGSATVSVSPPGHYTFQYTVTNSPCPVSTYELECDIFDIGDFEIGNGRTFFYCNDTFPAGTYPFCVNQYDDVIYSWVSDNPDVIVSPNNTACVDVIATNDVLLDQDNVFITINATRIYVDYDCEGPGEYEVLPLPFNNPNETVDLVIYELWQLGYRCILPCSDATYIQIFGSPAVEIEDDTLNFLCSDGTENVKLQDYYDVINGVSVKAIVTLISKPACAPPLGNLAVSKFLPLDVTDCEGKCGSFEFKIDLYSLVPGGTEISDCVTSFKLTFNIETPSPSPAGTDQIKCPDEPIRLNGDNPYCNAQGTWTQINCSNLDYYVVTIDSIHNPNTQIFIDVPNDSICPPDTLCFVWAFSSEGNNCNVSDTTRIIIRDSCCHLDLNCEERLHVATACVNDSLVLTVLNGMNQPVDPSEFTVHWSPMNITGNPVAFPYSTPVHYTVEIFKIVQSDTFCYTVLTGLAECAPECVWPEGCGVRVEESCDPSGDVIVTLVDIATNTPIVPTTYEFEIFWTVYGGGQNDGSGGLEQHENPIVIQQDACYSLRFNRRFFPPGAEPVPGYETSFCTFELPKTCPCVECPGPCADFNQFFIAGCGDTLDLALNLQFPANCQSVCNPSGYAVTLGVFHNYPPYAPVTEPQFHVLWENNATGPYAFGNLFSINTVTITSVVEGDTCEWRDSYSALCPCTTAPTNLHCEQPITKYCRPDGSFYYVAGAPQIVWSPVPGATGYIYEILTGNIPGCCNRPVGIISNTVYTTFYDIPANLPCFRFRVRAIIPYCENTPWSDYYTYCPQQIVCTPVITVCGCCHGERSGTETGFETRVVSEEEMLAFLNAHPGTEYPTLQEALNAAGVVATTEPEFAVYPNPANDKLVIQAGSTVSGNFTVQLTDLLNREWRNVNIDAAGQNTLNISDLPVGAYLITIKNAHGDRMLTEKVTVIR